MTKSPYRHKIGDITYCFSSRPYLEKFKSTYVYERTLMGERMLVRYGIKFYPTILSDIQLYLKIEKRGFYIEVGGIPCQQKESLSVKEEKLVLNN